MIFKKLRWRNQKKKCLKAEICQKDKLCNFDYCMVEKTPFHTCHWETCLYFNHKPDDSEEQYKKLGIKEKLYEDDDE